MKRKHRKFKTKYFFTDIFCLIPLLILILLLGTPGLNAGVQASDSVLGPNFNEYRDSRFGFASFQNNLQNFNPDPFVFDLNGEELLLNILDPTKPLKDVQDDSNVVKWDLFTNDWNVNIQFESIGRDNDECNDLTENYASEFFKYTITDGDSSVFGSREFNPGGSTSISGIEDDILDGTIKAEYDPGFSDKRWCAVRAGKYCDTILITISGDYSFDYRTETAYGGNLKGEEGSRGNAAWWNYFDKSEGYIQNVVAGKNREIVGTVYYEELSNDSAKIIIELDSGWSLDFEDGENGEPVKIQGYDSGELPVSRPIAGHFDYKGEELEVVADLYDYYVIHLDLINIY